MTVYAVKISKKKALAIILIIAIIIAAVIIAVPDRGGGNTETKPQEQAQTEQQEQQTQQEQAQAETSAIRAESNDDIIAYVSSLGYEVTAEPVDSRQVTIPETFDEVYTKYNEMQMQCGFDLAKYCGKEVWLYTYGVTNYQGYSDVLMDLLIYKNKIVGGSVYTAAVDGFMHGLMENPTKQ